MERTPEEKRAIERERWKTRYRTDPEFREKYLAARRRRADKEKNRQRVKEYYEQHRDERNKKRAEWTAKNKLRQLANQRELYRRTREENAAKERARRDARNPARVVRRLVKELNSGSIGLDEFARKVRKQALISDERLRKRIRTAKKRIGRGDGTNP